MARIDAALEWTGGKAYLFSGPQYVRLDLGTMRADPGYPRPIAGSWPGLFDRDIDAAILWSNGTAFFFRADEYARYDLAADRVGAGYPKPIAGNWPGLFDRDIGAAVVWGNGKAYFFRGDEYIRYDVASDRADPGYPKPIAGNWPGLFDRDIDAAFHCAAGKVAFIRGEEYLVYDLAADRPDPGYPRPVPPEWAGGPAGDPPPDPQAGPFSFDFRSGEGIGERIVRCCEAALADGPMGQNDRHDFYREFIACGQEKTAADAERLTGIHTSCAMFVRAVRRWCGGPATGPYKPGTGMFVSMGNVGFTHPAFVPHDGTNTPNPGDYFYIASSKQSTDGHTGIFIESRGPDTWRTAEGGGGDGTLCRFTTRRISGARFDNDARTLWGWFDCTSVGLPESG